MALRTFTSAGVNNLWSNAANWDTAPVDTDSFTLAAGQTCEFDADQSAWAGMAASTIPAGTTLIATTTAGAYVLKMNADLTVNGTLQAGTSVAVPYPSTCTFTINFSASANNIEVGAAGKIYFYCTEPVIKYVKLSAIEAIGQTVWSVDTDVSGDSSWVADASIIICDVGQSGMPETQTTHFHSATAAPDPTITVHDALTAAKAVGAYVVLRNRNIKITNTTSYAINFNASSSNSYVGADVYSCTSGTLGLGSGHTFAGCWSPTTIGVGGGNNTISGVIVGPTNGAYFTGGYLNSTVSGLVVGCSTGVRDGLLITLSGTVAGCGTGMSSANSTISATGVITGCGTGTTTYGINMLGTINLCTSGMVNAYSSNIVGTISNCVSGIVGGSAMILASATFVGNTNDLSQSLDFAAYNTAFGVGTEFASYNSTTYRRQSFYAQSFDHDGTPNAYKAWCLGGIVTSQTASPPSGYTIFYDHEVESATYPCLRQYLTTVLPGTAIEVQAVIRNPDGIDVSATTPIDLRPRLEIIDVSADPLVDSTQTALDSDPIAVSNGTNTDWQNVDVIWANTGDSPRQVYVRIICYSHDASTHTIDEAWSVADYQDQIADIHKRIRRLSATSEV